MRTHELKTLPEYFEEVWKGRKTFEVRKDDRGFKRWDRLRLNEWAPDTGYTGRQVVAEVSYIFRGEVAPGQRSMMADGCVVMAINVLITREMQNV